MDVNDMRKSLNHHVRLVFADGEVVDAILLGLNPGEDITYEVENVVSPATPPARGTAVGATCVADVGDLTGWSEMAQ